ncbi:hypothetical protein J2S10_004321 [Neobacillus ginsengisoli]|uniref:Uncharacterized protein n=1 Tax=Neobacillus ginsengisoli TaxID=904295 RepID=A0ABT9XZW5_9BACI|nr:hypothetical protein [Neobacillus ginsengisoli]
MESILYTCTYIGLFVAAMGIASFMYYKMMTEET